MKRKGETLTEFLTAVTVFGLMAAGIFEFIANQTENLADIKNKDELMYYANWLNYQTLGRYHVATAKDRNILRNINHKVEAGAPLTYNYKDKDSKITDSPSLADIENNIVSFDWDEKKHILTVKKNGQSLSFQLQP